MKEISKYIVFVALVVFFLPMVYGQKTTVSGNLSFKGTVHYERMIISEVRDNSLIPIDTVEISKDGDYKVVLEFSVPSLYVVQFSPTQAEMTHWFLEPKSKITLDYEVVGYPILSKVKGSRNMEIYKGFMERNAPIESLNRRYYLADEVGKKELANEFAKVYPEVQSLLKSYILKNKDVLVSAFLVTCFDQEFAKYITVYEEVRDALIVQYGSNVFVKNIDDRLKKSLLVGSKVPDIVMPSPDGKILKLSDLKGKIVLIDFWASWCGPCRRENPNVVRLYDRYKDKGFEIFSVSLDKDKTAWVKAIETDRLKWKNHVSDLKYWSSEAAKLYGVSSIPFTVLIDKDGRVIGKNLRGKELENKLIEVFEAE
jgi:thiol-disulfide isomerase/thioredoxin